MSTLTDLVRGRTDLDQSDLDHLHRLVADWQLVSDLSFADLVLWVCTRGGDWLAVAHMRPTTGPTAHLEDVVGTSLSREAAARLERAQRERRILREPDPVRVHGGRLRQESVPVRRGDRVVGVLSRDSRATAARMPSPLELAYLSSAGELLQMVAEGAFPYPGGTAEADPEHAPRVGDGLLRLDRTGHVVYASPNALSAHRRLGIGGDLLGQHLGQTVARLVAAPGRLDEPRASAALTGALRYGEPRESEVEAEGAVVLLRAMPLVTAGERRGALVLVRDVTELRRRDRQLMGKDATIREIHHRVKNNLQTVAALLRLQARRMADPASRSALEESVRRVSSIALVHETLSLTLDDQVAFDEVADRVLAMCAEVATPESEVRVVRDGSFGVLAAEVATPLAMVLTELVQNAVEHAFPADPAGRATAGTVRVRAARREGGLDVVVVDDGAGLPAGFDLAGSPRLGLQIVRTLVEGELRGRLALRPARGAGTEAVLDVPLLS
ncbi:MAG: putative signal transduction histidine kinase [Frankiales bacterium]|nr:putative signal transduction histidine kinase [Frankiales bacterium]